MVHAFPVDRQNTFRPSGDPLKDAPEEEKEDFYSTAGLSLPKTRAEQAAHDVRALRHYDRQHYTYWDNIRFGRIEREAAARQPKRQNRRSRKIRRALELLK